MTIRSATTVPRPPDVAPVDSIRARFPALARQHNGRPVAYAVAVADRLGHSRDGLPRIGCACYTTAEEIERLLEAVRAIAASGRH